MGSDFIVMGFPGVTMCVSVSGAFFFGSFLYLFICFVLFWFVFILVYLSFLLF